MSKSRMGVRHELEKLDNLAFTVSGFHSVVLLCEMVIFNLIY